ncbi:MAG: hypothetical protein WA763_23845 [Pseudolabrys sp.]
MCGALGNVRFVPIADITPPIRSSARIVDPGFEVDLYVTSQLRSMTAVWMGHSTLKTEIDSGNIVLTGDKAMTRSIHGWLGLSPFAKEKRRIAS